MRVRFTPYRQVVRGQGRAMRGAGGWTLVRVRFTPYRRVVRGQGRAARGAGGWTLARAPGPGLLRLRTRLGPRRLVSRAARRTPGPDIAPSLS